MKYKSAAVCVAAEPSTVGQMCHTQQHTISPGPLFIAFIPMDGPHEPQYTSDVHLLLSCTRYCCTCGTCRLSAASAPPKSGSFMANKYFRFNATGNDKRQNKSSSPLLDGLHTPLSIVLHTPFFTSRCTLNYSCARSLLTTAFTCVIVHALDLFLA